MVKAVFSETSLLQHHNVDLLRASLKAVDSRYGSIGTTINYKTGAKLGYKMVEGRHSGEAMTSTGNSGNNIWITETSYRMVKVDKYLKLALILGDDNLSILEVPNNYNVEALS